MKNISISTRARKCAAVGCLTALAVTTGAAGRVSAAPIGSTPVSKSPVSATPISSTPVSDTVVLRGHIPALVARSQAVARLDSARPLSLALTLPLRNQAGLTDLLQRLYDPSDPQYGQYLTPDEFAARFGPTESDYNKIAAYAQAAGLRIDGTHPNRTILDVSGTASQVERAFGVQIQVYQSPDDGRYFYAPTSEPSVSKSAAALISGIVGLDNANLLRPHHHLVASHDANDLLSPFVLPHGGNGLGGGLAPADIKNAYGLSSVSLTGTGQSLALYELDGYTASDVTLYETYYGLPNVPLQNVLVDGFSGTPSSRAGNGPGEVTLDIELQIALARGASKIYVYEGANGTRAVLDTYNRIATDNFAKQVSTSWGLPEASESNRNTENAIFQQMAAQGQSIFAASGDSGAYDNGSSLSVDDPASQPYMTGVGGTTITTSGNPSAYGSEKTWSGGGGGISIEWSIPSYQVTTATTSHANFPAGLVSTTKRNVPDVSLDADPNTGYSIIFNGGGYIFGGTSCAAPLWSAFAALVNQQRAASGYNPIGFFNPALYTIANGPRYSTDFHDIADNSTNLYYPAVTGYDVATGLGTFQGASLLADLTNSVPISGTVSLQAATGSLAQPLTFTITPTGTPAGATAQPVTTQTITTAADGTFTLYGVPAGVYTLGIKGAKWLKKNVTNVDTTAGAKTGLAVTLLGGDLDGNNSVDINDFTVLRSQFNTSGTNLLGDINCDGTVDINDFNILRANFNKAGD